MERVPIQTLSKHGLQMAALALWDHASPFVPVALHQDERDAPRTPNKRPGTMRSDLPVTPFYHGRTPVFGVGRTPHLHTGDLLSAKLETKAINTGEFSCLVSVGRRSNSKEPHTAKSWKWLHSLNREVYDLYMTYVYLYVTAYGPMVRKVSAVGVLLRPTSLEGETHTGSMTVT